MPATCELINQVMQSQIPIRRDFWNFICDSNDGNEMVIDAYKKHAHFVKEALEEIIEAARKNSVQQKR